METVKSLSILGLIIGLIGTYMMFHFTPKADSRTILYRDRKEMEEVMKKDHFKNKMVRLGMLFLFISFLFQVVALIIQ